jgi:hypothetical protein
MVQILAPANLYEGYKFDATYNGVSFPVIVVSVFILIKVGIHL